MKVLILGSSGILGQTLRITPHPGIVATYHAGREAVDLTDEGAVEDLIIAGRPDVVVNLAGESRPDVVEANPQPFDSINICLAGRLSWFAKRQTIHLIHVSTQAVFDGENAPYSADSEHSPINEYGRQKSEAEEYAGKGNVTIIRPTFVLGIRPNPAIGRPNPVELMLEGQRNQVNDRWFSPSFAPDVARLIWDVATRKPSGEVIHAGVPIRTTRYEIARALGCDVVPVSHEDFPGIAPRPRDTTYATGSVYGMSFGEGIADCLRRWKAREAVAA